MTLGYTKRVLALVPARMASSRFPGKPLVRFHGLPMVEHLRRRALLADGVADVAVATSGESILHTVRAAGDRAVMTANTNERCMDRVEEAMRSLDADVIVQGAEPLFAHETLPWTRAIFKIPTSSKPSVTSAGT